eukprot:gene33785-12681_t
MRLIEQGRFNRVPFIVGTNSDEYNAFFLPGSRPANATEVRCAFEHGVPAKWRAKLLEVYAPVEAPGNIAPGNPSGLDSRRAISEFMSDTVFHCDSRKLVRALAAAGTAPWVYSFRRPPACGRFIPGAFHTAEIGYVFEYFPHNYSLYPPGYVCDVGGDDVALMRKVASLLWAGFARDGAPPAEWPRYAVPAEPLLKIDLGTCDAVDALYSDPSGLSGVEYNIVASLARCQNGTATPSPSLAPAPPAASAATSAAAPGGHSGGLSAGATAGMALNENVHRAQYEDAC